MGSQPRRGFVYSSFSREDHVISHDRVLEMVDETNEWRMYGYDAGWRDPRILLEIGKTDHGQLLVIDKFHQSKSHVDDAVSWLQSNQKPKGPIFCEHEPADIQKFRGAGYHANKAKKSIDAGIARVRRRLGEDGEGHGGPLISDRCQHLIREFLGYKEAHVGTSQAKDHCLDSLRYAVMGYDKAESYHSGPHTVVYKA